MRTWQDFDLIQLVVLPMFLFSGTFFPIDRYPAFLQIAIQATPLYRGVDLLRSLSLGIVGPSIVVDIVYLSVMGALGLAVVSRRLDRLLLR
jgi:lipooligosaccharide transport system permease protein